MKNLITVKIILIIFLIVNIIISNHIKADSKDKKIKISDFPAKDLPDELGKSKYINGDSYRYYYGIGKQKNYIEARYAALIELEKYGDNKVFGGSAILMMLYANGLGVTKNINLALNLAKYNVKGATAEIEGRIESLVKIKNSKQPKFFDLCDDITSGIMMGYCAIRDSDIENQNFDSTISRIVEKWDKEARIEFLYFRTKIMEYIDYKSETETDRTGSAATMVKIEERQRLRKFFFNAIIFFESGKTLNNKDSDCTKAEKELSNIYSKLIKKSKGGHSEFDIDTTIWFDIQSAQYKWFEYREVWTSFVISRYPKISKESVCDWITKERIKELKVFIVENKNQDDYVD